MRLLLFALLIIATVQSRADCECLWQGSFADVQHSADLVVSGTVIAGKGNSIDLSIDQLLRGKASLPDVRIWLKALDYCRPEAEKFPIGSQWVMALHKINVNVPGGFNPNTPNISYGRIGDFQLSNCGGYWLSQTGDRVTGNLVNAPRWERDPKMTPVLLDLIAKFVNGEIDNRALLTASREDPAVRELMLDTKAFLRGDEE